MARFLYERTCGAGCVLLLCVAVRLSVRSVSGFAGTFRWILRGSARCTESVGWGTPPPHSPRVAERSGRRMPPPGLTYRQVSCGVRTSRRAAVAAAARPAQGGRKPPRGFRKPIKSATEVWLNIAGRHPPRPCVVLITAGLPRRAGEGKARRGSPPRGVPAAFSAGASRRRPRPAPTTRTARAAPCGSVQLVPSAPRRRPIGASAPLRAPLRPSRGSMGHGGAVRRADDGSRVRVRAWRDHVL